MKTQTGDFDRVFGKTEPRSAGRSNGRGRVQAAEQQGAGVPFGDASADFPVRGGNAGSGTQQIIGEDCGYIPPAGVGHVEIVINSGVKPGVLPVSEPVDVIKVAVIPEEDRTRGALGAVFNPNRPINRDPR